MTTKTTKITLVPSLDGYAIVPIKDWNEANSSSGEVEYQRQELERENTRMRELLTRYRNETPLGNQPHMIAHQVDAALANEERTPTR